MKNINFVFCFNFLVVASKYLLKEKKNIPKKYSSKFVKLNKCKTNHENKCSGDILGRLPTHTFEGIRA